MESGNTPEPIDLTDLIHRFCKSLAKLWPLTLALAIIFGCFNFIRAKSTYTPRYESKATFSVSSGYGDDDVFSYSYHYDNTAAKELAAAFPHLLNTDMLRDLMLEQLGTSYINGTITATSVAETNMFELCVRSSSPQDAYDILCSVIDCYPKVAMIMVENPSVIIRKEPTVPTTPYNSFDGTQALSSGALTGLALGLGIVCIAAMLNKTFIRPEDLKREINLPLLASIPHVTAKKRRAYKQRFISAEDDCGLAEALRGLRTKVRKLLSDWDGSVVMITSTVPGEGKSTVSANLALSLSSEGHRVVLVDADLRNQTIFRMFGSGQSQKGLMDCLNNPRLSALSCLQSVSGTNLCYLSGTSTKKRHYSIDAKSMRRVLDELIPKFDYVIVDSPPCGIVSDTALLGRYADCVLYVVKQDYANQNQILEAITGLYERDIPLSGCILNNVPRSRIHHGYGYGYGYGKNSKYAK